MTILSDQLHLHPDQLGAYWMPFTSNRHFKAAPRMLASADGMYYKTDEGKTLLDGFAGLWCCHAGHNRKPIVEAIQKQAATLDFCSPFQFSHPLAFELANRIIDIAPDNMQNVFFCNSGSEAVDTALKIALAWHRVRGEGARTRLIGRERGYHGVGFGGISVGGMVANRKMFGSLLAGVDHLQSTHNLEHNAYSPGQPEWGAHLADELERLVALHDASTIAAVIVEPMAGSTGVLFPPKGYLQRLREITKKHGILLIFDEVITGYGRLGGAFAADVFGVQPDMITFAKGVTSGYIPLGGVMVGERIARVLIDQGGEFNHGYTYSGHPVACAVGLANVKLIQRLGLVEHVRDDVGPHLAAAFAQLAEHPLVGDAETCGLMGALLLVKDKAQGTSFDADLEVGMLCRGHCFREGLVMRAVGDRMIIAPPLVITRAQIDEMAGLIRRCLDLTLADVKARGWM